MSEWAISARRLALRDGYEQTVFAGVAVTRGLFRCTACGAEQGDYVLPGSDDVVTCEPCSACGGEWLDVVELVGRIPYQDGEINLLPYYVRDIASQEPNDKEST